MDAYVDHILHFYEPESAVLLLQSIDHIKVFLLSAFLGGEKDQGWGMKCETAVPV